LDEFIGITDKGYDEYNLNQGNLKSIIFDNKSGVSQEVERDSIRPDQSILSQRKDVERYPFLAFLGDWLSNVRLYRDWVFSRDAPARRPQPTDFPDEYLEEDAHNLSVVLRRLMANPTIADRLQSALRALYDGLAALVIRDNGAVDEVGFLVSEDNGRAIPGSRLSDGTIRYLSLLAVLCDPNPASLVCIEEPELGLHPDIIPTIADLLVEASERTQLIITTHSADLISALGSVPESVVVCERGIAGTTLRRLEADRLRKWLEKYTLGHLWAMGEIGGNRW
jgi:predicted ATPase